jgi:pimeloyl-ACP methyl ester carboxylesterase
MVLIMGSLFQAGISMLVGILLFLSRGKPKTFVDEKGNTAMVRKLEAAPVTVAGGTPHAYLAIRDKAMHSLGIGTTHDMKSIITGIFLPSLASPEYTLREKVDLWRSKFRSGAGYLWDTMIATDLAKKVPKLDLPVYFLHGIYDYTCSSTEAKAYCEQLKAPLKGFYTFKQSAHSPMFEEPEKTLKILQEDVLDGYSRSIAEAYASVHPHWYDTTGALAPWVTHDCTNDA